MANRAEYRSRLRARLVDPALGGLWTDAELNDAIREAAAWIGAYIPEVASMIHVGTLGNTGVAYGHNIRAILQILDPAGNVVPNIGNAPVSAAPHYALGWYQQGPLARFSRPLLAAEVGNYTVSVLRQPSAIGDDATQYPIPESADVALIDRACAICIRSRLADDVRRSRMVDATALRLADTLDATALAAIKQAGRIARGTSF